MKKLSIILLSLLILIIFYTLALAEKIFLKPETPVEKIIPKQAPAAPKPSPEIAPSNNFATPSRVVGIYSTSWVAGSKRMDQIIDFIKRSGVNSIVIDIKDDTGVISYPTSIPLANEMGAGSKRIANIKELITRLKKENVYLIARIVVFKDPLLAKKHPEIAVKDKNGGLWHDRKGMIWVDPHNRIVWKYNLDLAKEAIGLGFSEIQFDYVRFLSDGKISNCVYPFSKGEAKEDVIKNFLLYAKKDINALGVPLSADIFGLVLSVPDDLNLGQKFEKIAQSVDYISPMIYPSHYPKGSFGFSDPDSHPYEVIDKAMQDGVRRLKNSSAKLRPWIQDFSLGHTYGRPELLEQIRAMEANGVHDFLLWNPTNKYELSKYENL